MSECFPKDVLLRVGGATLHRFGYPAVAGSRRGPVELPLTFARADASTCATYIDRDGTVRVAEANKLRREFVDLDGDGVRESPGLLLEGSTVIKSRYSQDFTNWTPAGTPVLGATLSLGVLSIRQVTDDDGATSEDHHIAYGASALFVGNGVKGVCIHVSKGASPPASGSRVQINDSTAVATRLSAIITWSGTTPSVNMAGGGTLLRQQQVGVVGSAIIWRLDFQTTAVTAANNHDVLLIPASTAAETGDIYWGGFQADSALAFPSSYVVTTNTDVTRAADSLTLPFNFGPMDLTVLAKIARPVWADAVGTITIPGICQISDGGANSLRFYGVDTSRNWQTDITIAGSPGSFAARAITAGTSIAMSAQFKNLGTGGQGALESTAGQSAFASAVAAMGAYSNQTLRVGSTAGGTLPLYGVLLDLKVFRGLFTLAEAGAVD